MVPGSPCGRRLCFVLAVNDFIAQFVPPFARAKWARRTAAGPMRGKGKGSGGGWVGFRSRGCTHPPPYDA